MSTTSLFGLMSYAPASVTTNTINLGDYIQSIAARQFLPKVDALIDREQMSNYDGDDINLIMNGWFMTHPENWPPSKHIKPLITSFHINGSVENQMLSEESIRYLKSHEPIGCRDSHTCDLLSTKGVDAFFSGCLTLTLGNTYKHNGCSGKVLFVNVLDEFKSLSELILHPRTTYGRIKSGLFRDAFYKRGIMNKLFDKRLQLDANYLNQSVRPRRADNLLDMADAFLKQLAAAKFVVTSKLHTALPCLAMGTPVIFINGGLYEYANIGRLSGLIDLLNVIDVDRNHNVTPRFDIKLPLTVDSEFSNRSSYKEYADKLTAQCRQFVANALNGKQ